MKRYPLLKIFGTNGLMKSLWSILTLLLLVAGPTYGTELEYSFTFNTVDLLEDGRPLTDLAGYRLYYAVDESVTTSSEFIPITLDQVLSETTVSFEVALPARTEPYVFQFAITAVRENGLMGILSDPVIKRVLMKDVVQPVKITGFYGTLRCLTPGCEVMEL